VRALRRQYKRGYSVLETCVQSSFVVYFLPVHTYYIPSTYHVPATLYCEEVEVVVIGSDVAGNLLVERPRAPGLYEMNIPWERREEKRRKKTEKGEKGEIYVSIYITT